jgi:hypothetical protein
MEYGMSISAGFGSGRKKLLLALGMVIVTGSAILLIDEWLRSQHAEISAPAELQQIANGLGMQVVSADSQSTRLLPLLQSIPALSGNSLALGDVLMRDDADHTLWLVEYQQDATLLHSPSGTGARRQRGELTRLAIVLWRRNAHLPIWEGSSDRELPSAWDRDIQQRLGRIDDLWISTGGELLVARARGLDFGLQEMVQRQQSAEFLPGLRNSSLAIDTQRVLDLAQRMTPALPALAPVYRPLVEVNLPETRAPDIRARLQPILQQRAAERAAVDAEIAARNAAAREEMAARSEASYQAMRDHLDASRENLRNRIDTRQENRAGTEPTTETEQPAAVGKDKPASERD